jgi:hypothetical protein
MAGPAKPAVEPSFFVTGGTLRHDARCYVERQADKAISEGLRRGEFCYVLTSRQMGKSSLMVRAADRLRGHQTQVAVIDLTAVGQNLTPEQWYNGLLARTGSELRLEEELEAFWSERVRLSPVQRFFAAVREVVLPERPGALVVFVDEIDAVRGLPFSTDEFFGAIRACYNQRVEDREFNRLTFCLLGVATPADLIRDPRNTPFHIGQRIELTDFTEREAAPLAAGLRVGNWGTGKGQVEPAALLQRILYWTNGHPYLTQQLCRALVEGARAGTHPPSISDSSQLVDWLCGELFLSPRARERDDNLLFVRERLLRSEADLTSLLGLYQEIRNGQRVRDDESNPLIDDLRLAGITRQAGGLLEVRNRIYHRVFDDEWIQANKPDASLVKPDGERVPIKGSCTIGRAPTNDVVLLGDRVSRRHAQIQAQQQNEFWLVDLGSSNGTYHNGQRVVQPVLLRDQDQIDVGQFRLVFRQTQRGQAATPADGVVDKTIVDLRL